MDGDDECLQLIDASCGEILANNLAIADTFVKRFVGLIGKSSLVSNDGLWINPCHSIHTFFMNFSIDAVFVDENLVVVAVLRNVTPWKISKIIPNAKSVFELPSGKASIAIGNTLQVIR